MKVVPSNQTLILANERPNVSGPSAKMLDQALNYPANGSALQRVTIVAAHSDESILYVQADYSPPASSQSYPSATTLADQAVLDSDTAATSEGAGALVPTVDFPVAARQALATVAGRRDAFGNLTAMNRQVGLYARTQSMSDARLYPRVDVLA